MKKAICGILIWATAWSLQAQVQPVFLSYQGALLHPTFGAVTSPGCVADMDGDFLDDVVRVGGKGIFIDYQLPDGGFKQGFFPMLVQAYPDWSICAGDIDNNGFNDLLFGNMSGVSFVKAGQDGKSYTEHRMPVTLLSQRSTFADINSDGWLDAFVCNDTARNYPFRNTGFGIMEPDTQLIKVSKRPGNYSAIWTDYDNDRDIDLYITKCFGTALPGHPDRTNLLYRNNGDGSFTEVGAAAGVADNAQSWSTVFEDFDNDGDFDAFVVNHDQANRLYRNNGNGTFTDVIQGSGIDADDLGNYENASGDFNNDGFMDIFSDMDQELYLGRGDLTFVGQNASPVVPGAIGDLNNDGFLDVVRTNQLWINERGINPNHWVKFNLLGLESNRNGIGARLILYGAWGEQHRELRAGQSYSPMSSLTLHFGLGAHQSADSLKVLWPSGRTTLLAGLSADTTYLIPEADCLIREFDTRVLSVSVCEGDSVWLEAGAGYASYWWSNGQIGPTLQVDAPGRYFVVVENENGCKAIESVYNVSRKRDQTPGIRCATSNTICKGDSLVLTATGGDDFFWSTGDRGASLPLFEAGMYQVGAIGVCSQDTFYSTPFQVNVLDAQEPIVQNIVVGIGDTAVLVAEGENCRWYDQPAGGALLAVGDTLIHLMAMNNAVYYVENRQSFPPELQSGGKKDTLGGGGKPQQGGFLYFSAYHPFKLISVKVYVPPGAPQGSRFVHFYSDTLLAYKQFQVTQGENLLQLGFDVPVGSFSLRCPQGNLYRNDGGVNYPYPIGDAGAVTGSSFGDQYYYYFYDWIIEKPGLTCVSERVPVTVVVSDASSPSTPQDLKIAPNPAGNTVTVQLPETCSGTTQVALSDLLGKTVLERQLSCSNTFELDLSEIVSGVYVLTLCTDEQKHIGKLVIRKE